MFFPSGRGVTLSASRQRLEKLIEERAEPNANKDAIDRRIWNLLGAKRAVMFTDLSGFSRNVAKFGPVHFLHTIYASIQIFVPLIERHDGILLKAEADSLLVMFGSPDPAMACAVEMQQGALIHNQKVPPESFDVDGVNFSYSEGVIKMGFGHTACWAGPIHEGLYVRIWYVDRSTGRHIIHLEARR